MKINIKVLIGIFLIFAICICLYVYSNCKPKEENNSINNIDRIIQEQIKIETEEHNLSDVLLNVNGEQIIYFEYLTVKSQIEELKKSDSDIEIEENPLLKLVQDKLKINIAKTYPDLTTMGVDIDTIKNNFEEMWNTSKDEYLKTLNISYNFFQTDEELHDYLLSYYLNMYGMNVGTDIVFKLMLNKPELVKDDYLKSIVEQYNTSSVASLDLLNQIYSVYLTDLVKIANIEFSKDEKISNLDISYLDNFNVKSYKTYDKIYLKQNDQNIEYVKEQEYGQDFLQIGVKQINDIDISEFENCLDYSYLEIEDYETYLIKKAKFGLNSLTKLDFTHANLYLIVANSNLEFTKIVQGYNFLSDEEIYSLLYKSQKANGTFLYQVLIPNYMTKNINFVEGENDILVSQDEAYKVAKDFLDGFEYKGINGFNITELLISRGYVNDFLTNENKEHIVNYDSKISYEINAKSTDNSMTVTIYVDTKEAKIIGGHCTFKQYDE